MTLRDLIASAHAAAGRHGCAYPAEAIAGEVVRWLQKDKIVKSIADLNNVSDDDLAKRVEQVARAFVDPDGVALYERLMSTNRAWEKLDRMLEADARRYFPDDGGSRREAVDQTRAEVQEQILSHPCPEDMAAAIRAGVLPEPPPTPRALIFRGSLRGWIKIVARSKVIDIKREHARESSWKSRQRRIEAAVREEERREAILIQIELFDRARLKALISDLRELARRSKKQAAVLRLTLMQRRVPENVGVLLSELAPDLFPPGKRIGNSDLDVAAEIAIMGLGEMSLQSIKSNRYHAVKALSRTDDRLRRADAQPAHAAPLPSPRGRPLMQLLLTLFWHAARPDDDALGDRDDLRALLDHADFFFDDGTGTIVIGEIKAQLDEEIMRPALLAQMLNYLAALEAESGDGSQARADFARALDLAKEGDDDKLVTYINANWALAEARYRPIDGTRNLRAAHRALIAAGEQEFAAKVANNLGVLALTRGDAHAAVDQLAVAVDELVGRDERGSWLFAAGNLAAAHLSLGNLDRAEHELVAAVREAAAWEDRSAEARLLTNLAFVHLEQGRTRTAEVELANALRIARSANDVLVVEAAGRSLRLLEEDPERVVTEAPDEGEHEDSLVTFALREPTPARGERARAASESATSRRLSFEERLLELLAQPQAEQADQILQTLAGLRDLTPRAIAGLTELWTAPSKAVSRARVHETLAALHTEHSLFERIVEGWQHAPHQQLRAMLNTWSEEPQLSDLWFVAPMELTTDDPWPAVQGQQPAQLVEEDRTVRVRMATLPPRLLGQRIALLIPDPRIERLAVEWASGKPGVAVSTERVRAGRVEIELGQLGDGSVDELAVLQTYLTSLNGTPPERI